MFKTLITLVRGSAERAAESLADDNALLLLDQQMRDAARSVERAKRSLALAIAQDEQEKKRLEVVVAEIADLEVRIVAAMDAGRDALAREGAEGVAALEAERDASSTARTLFAAEIERLRNHVRQAESRLSALDRGRRIARASEAVRDLRKGRVEAASPYQSTLSDAEKTLSRLRQQQQEAQAAEDALEAIDLSTSPRTAAEKLAEHGFGPRLKSSADDVLARLRARAETKPAA